MRPKKFYFASRFEDRFRLRAFRAQLERRGHAVTSRWLNHGPQIRSVDPSVNLHDNAMMDLEDVRASDAFVLFTDVDGILPMDSFRGGRELELGYLLALHHHHADHTAKDFILIGERRNVFHHLGVVSRFADWLDFLRALDASHADSD